MYVLQGMALHSKQLKTEMPELYKRPEIITNNSSSYDRKYHKYFLLPPDSSKRFM